MATRRGFSKPAPVTALPGQGAAGGGGGRGRRDRGAASGLHNAGNSCWFNAVLQALLGQRSFVNDLLQAAAVLQGHVTPAQRAKAERAQQAAAERAAAARARREAGHDSDSEWPPSGGGHSADSLPAAASRLSHTFYDSLLSLVRDMRTSAHGILDASQLQELVARRYQRFAGDDQQDAHEFLSECLTHLDDDIGHMLKQHAHAGEQESKTSNEATDAAAQTSPAAASASASAPPTAAAAPATRGRSSPSTAAASSASLRPSTPSPPPAFMSSPSSLQLQVDTLSPIYRNFHIEVEQRLECVTCAYTRCRTEHFTELSLDLPEQGSRAATGSPSSRSASPANSLAPSPAPLPAPSSRTPLHPISPEPHSPDSPASPSLSPPLNLRRTLPPRAGRSSTASDGSVSASPSPLPVPECPKHLRPMVPLQVIGAAAAAATTSIVGVAAGSAPTAASAETQYRCPTQRCKEVRSMPASASFDVSLSAMGSPSATGAAAAKTIAPVRRIGKGSNGGCAVSLSDLLCQFFSPSITTYRCERCSGDKLKQSYAFRQLPRVLILHLKRFTPNLVKGSYEKRTDRVKVDEQIDLGFACTTHTRKPLPLDNSGPDDASAPSHFAALFASSAIAACKCGAGADKCKHAEGILATPDDIASFIAHQSDAAAAAAASAAGTSARNNNSAVTRSQRNKRKSEGLQESADELVERKKTKSSGSASGSGSSTPSPPPSEPISAVGAFALPPDDCASFFLSGAAAGAAQRLSARINTLQGDIRHLQHQIHSINCGSGVDPSSGGGLATSVIPSRRKRDQVLQGMVMRMSEMEATLKVQKEEQRRLYEQERDARPSVSRAAGGADSKHNGSSSSSSCLADSGSHSSSTSGGVSPGPASSLGPSVVPVYELQSVIHHKGPIATSGHYLTDLKSESCDAQQTAVWRRYDDQYVRVIDAAQAMQYGESAGYIFIYTYQPLNNLQHEQMEAAHAHAQAQLTTATSSETTEPMQTST